MRELLKRKHVEIWEYPPRKRTIVIEARHFQGNRHIENKIHTLHVWFPYLVFARAYAYPVTRLWAYFAKEPVNENTLLYFPSLPNVYSNSNVCLDDLPNRFAENSLIELVNYFWTSSYYDVTGYYDHEENKDVPHRMHVFEDVVEGRWQWPGTNLMEKLGGMEGWPKLSLEEVMERVNWANIPYSQAQLI